MTRLLGLLFFLGGETAAGAPCHAADSISFTYAQGTSAPETDRGNSTCRTHQQSLPPTAGIVYVYGSFGPLKANPAELMDGEPSGSQTVTIGRTDAGKFTPAVSFGMVKDTHAGLGKRAMLLPWLLDGQFDRYGMFARPHTPYDFRLKIDLENNRLTAWVSGRGDDDWFLLAEDAPLQNPVDAIDSVRAEQNIGAPNVELTIRSAPWSEAEQVQSHPQSKGNRQVVDGADFKFQSMRSLWAQSERHVTIARNNPKTAPKETAWLGFPDVVQADPNTLVCSFTAGGAHGGRGPILVSRSADLGKTWSTPVAIHPSGVNCSRIQKLQGGSLLILVTCTIHPVDGNASGR